MLNATVSNAAWAQETIQGVVPGTRQTIIAFEDRAVQNEYKSEQEGRPIFETRVYIRKIPPGDKLVEVHRPATKHDFQQWPQQYEAYKTKSATPISGTALEAWSALATAQVFELKAMNIFTVEQLADLPDSYGHRFMGFQNFKQKAQAFLRAAKGQAEFEKMEAVLKDAAEKNAKLQAQLDDTLANQSSMMETMKAMQAQISQMSGPAPAAGTLHVKK